MWKMINYLTIFKSGSRVIIAVRVACAPLAYVKRGWLLDYKVVSGVWRSWLCRSTKLVASWLRRSTEPAATRLRGSSRCAPAHVPGL